MAPPLGFYLPIQDAAICADCKIFFAASEGKCPTCSTVSGWMLVPVKFVTEPLPEKVEEASH